MSTFNRSQLLDRLRILDRSRKVAFAACCCERLLPNYLAAVSHSELGAELGSLSDQTEPLWTYSAATENASLPRPQAIAELWTQRRLALNDSQIAWASLGEWAAGGMEYAFRLMASGDDFDCVEVARCAYETVKEWSYLTQMYNPEQDGADRELAISIGLGSRVEEAESAPIRFVEKFGADYSIVKAELAKQLFDLQVLTKLNQTDAATLQTLRRSSQKRGVQPFLRGLLSE